MAAPLPRLTLSGDRAAVLAGALAAACAVSGHAPLWMLPLWALALGLWSLDERRRSIVPALALLLALLPAWPALGDLSAFTALYLRLALSGLAAALFVQHLDEHGHWLWLALLALAWALAPTPLGLFGLLAAALLRAGVMQRGTQRVVSRAALAWLLGLSALLALGSALLPHPQPLPGPQARPEQQAGAPQAPVSQAPVKPGSGGGLRGAPARPAAAPPAPLPQSLLLLERLVPYLLLAMALLTGTLLAMALSLRTRRGERLRPEDLVLVAGLLTGFVMTLLYFLVRQRGGSGLLAGGGSQDEAGATSATSGETPLSRLDLSGALNAAGWLAVGAAVLFLVLSVLALAVLLRAGLARGRAAGAAPSRPAAPSPALSPEHRVRRAYRQMLALLADRALGRRDSETPQEYQGRLGSERPELAEHIQTITRLYEPVRYGGQTDERGAQAAEDALGHIRTTLESA